MKILLIPPFLGKKDLDFQSKIYRERIFLSPNLGLYQIARGLLDKGMDCDVIDANFPDCDIRQILESRAYDIIGLSTTHITLENDLGLLNLARQASPSAKLVVGGIEATFNSKTFFDHSPVDAIVLGEGEEVFLKMCLSKDWEKIPGLYLRGRDQLKELFTGSRPALDKEEFTRAALGVDFAKVPYERYWDYLKSMHQNELMEQLAKEIHTIRLFTSNYCPYKCSFCSSTNFRNFVGGRNTKVVALTAIEAAGLLKNVLKAHPLTQTVFFADDNFLLDHARAKGICQSIIEAKGQGTLPRELTFITSARIDDLKEDSLSMMEKAGFRVLDCGVESFSSQSLEEFSRAVTIEQIHRGLEMLLKTRIVPYITVILTSPDCTVPDIKETLSQLLAYCQKGVRVSLNPYVWALKGSDIYKRKDIKIKYKEARIPWTDSVLKKEDIILPNNSQVANLMERFDRELPETREALISAHNLRFVSSEKNSLIYMYLLFKLLGEEGSLKKAAALLSRYSLKA